MTHAIVFGFGIALAGMLTAFYRNWQVSSSEPRDQRGIPKLLATLPVLVGLFFAVASGHGYLSDRDPHWLITFFPGVALVAFFAPLLFKRRPR